MTAAKQKAQAIVIALKARLQMRRQPTLSEVYDNITEAIIAEGLEEFVKEKEQFLEGRHHATVQHLHRTIDDLQAKLKNLMARDEAPNIYRSFRLAEPKKPEDRLEFALPENAFILEGETKCVGFLVQPGMYFESEGVNRVEETARALAKAEQQRAAAL